MSSFGSLFFFPLAYEEAAAGRAFTTEHEQNDSDHVFDASQESGLWRFSLSGIKILAQHIDTFDAFHEAVKGQWKPFLFRLKSRRFEIRREQVGGIGTGNGVQTQFQLVKARSYGYGPANRSTEVVRYPHHDYPSMRVPVGNAGGVEFYKTELVRVWVNGIEKQLGTQFTIEREGGIVTFTQSPANGALIEAECQFWVPVHGQDLFLISHGAGVYTFAQSAELFQVPGE